MKEHNVYRIIGGVALFVALIAAATAIGWMAYSAGVTHGAAQAAGTSSSAAPYGPGGPFLMPAFGFGWLGCLVPLAFLFLAFSVFRLVAWGGTRRHLHEGWGSHGPCVPGGMRGIWRERMEDWHRQAHAGGSGEPSANQPSA